MLASESRLLQLAEDAVEDVALGPRRSKRRSRRRPLLCSRMPAFPRCRSWVARLRSPRGLVDSAASGQHSVVLGP